MPLGSEVRGRVTTAVPSGRAKTRARLAFAFDTLVLEGKEHSIGTRRGRHHRRRHPQEGRRDHREGAGAGAIIGAITKGGKGAAVGTLIGGAAGTGVVLIDKGKEVRLGTGSLVNVRLTREARL